MPFRAFDEAVLSCAITLEHEDIIQSGAAEQVQVFSSQHAGRRDAQK
jgi:hypothetical protein